MVIKKSYILNMKQIPNKTTDIPGTFDGVQRKTTYADLMDIVMKQITDDNNTITMRKDFRVLDAIEKSVKENAETIDLEDADATHLLNKIKATAWGFKNKGIIDFEDDIAEIISKKKEDKKEDKAETKTREA